MEWSKRSGRSILAECSCSIGPSAAAPVPRSPIRGRRKFHQREDPRHRPPGTDLPGSVRESGEGQRPTEHSFLPDRDSPTRCGLPPHGCANRAGRRGATPKGMTNVIPIESNSVVDALTGVDTVNEKSGFFARHHHPENEVLETARR
jgi:hypothetical protein